MNIYKLTIVDKIFINRKLYGTVRKTIELPFIPLPDIKIRSDGIQIELGSPKNSPHWVFPLPELIYDCDEKLFKYFGVTERSSEHDAKQYVELLLSKSKGYIFEPYIDNEKCSD